MFYPRVYSVLLLFILINLTRMQSITTTPDSNIVFPDIINVQESRIEVSCFTNYDVLILQDTIVKYGNETIQLSNSTSVLTLHDCAEVHLSGSTLLTLDNVTTLELNNIDQIHVDSKFFSHYATQLRALKIYNSSFSALESSININAHKFEKIILDNMSTNESLSFLIHTEDNHTLDLISITNCQTPVLGEINVSTRSVKKFIMENNTIGMIQAGAILLSSNTTTISGNKIDELKLLSVDITTNSFNFSNNTCTKFVKSGIQVQEASQISITSNVFYDIEQHSFLFLMTRVNGSFSFTYNHIYHFDHGSLQFYYTAYNRNLHIRLNALHVSNCDCKTIDMIEDMTGANNKSMMDFHHQHYMTFELLKETTACVDEKGNEKSMEVLCTEKTAGISWMTVMLSITIFITIIGIVVTVLKQRQKCRSNNNRQGTRMGYSVNVAYLDDSDNEEYVRK